MKILTLREAPDDLVAPGAPGAIGAPDDLVATEEKGMSLDQGLDQAPAEPARLVEEPDLLRQAREAVVIDRHNNPTPPGLPVGVPHSGRIDQWLADSGNVALGLDQGLAQGLGTPVPWDCFRDLIDLYAPEVVELLPGWF